MQGCVERDKSKVGKSGGKMERRKRRWWLNATDRGNPQREVESGTMRICVDFHEDGTVENRSISGSRNRGYKWDQEIRIQVRLADQIQDQDTSRNDKIWSKGKRDKSQENVSGMLRGQKPLYTIWRSLLSINKAKVLKIIAFVKKRCSGLMPSTFKKKILIMYLLGWSA